MASKLSNLPGSRPYPAADAKRFIVQLHPDPSVKSGGRGEFVAQSTGRVARFQENLLRDLKERGLRDGLEWMSEPGPAPLISVGCTKSVAERIRDLPEVERVFEDQDDLSLVR